MRYLGFNSIISANPFPTYYDRPPVHSACGLLRDINDAILQTVVDRCHRSGHENERESEASMALTYLRSFWATLLSPGPTRRHVQTESSPYKWPIPVPTFTKPEVFHSDHELDAECPSF